MDEEKQAVSGNKVKAQMKETPKCPQSVEEAKRLIYKWKLQNLSNSRFLKRPTEKCSCHKRTCEVCFEYKLLNHIYTMSQKNPNWLVTLSVDSDRGNFSDMTEDDILKEFQKYKKNFLRRIKLNNGNVPCHPDAVFERGAKCERNYHIHILTRSDYFLNTKENKDPKILKDWKHATGHKKGCRVHVRIYRDVYALTYLLKNYDGTRKYLWLSKSPDIGSRNIPFLARRLSNPVLKDNNEFWTALRNGDREKVIELRRKLLEKSSLYDKRWIAILKPFS